MYNVNTLRMDFVFTDIGTMSESPGQVYTINSVKVQFPCKAYPSQLSMMDKVRIAQIPLGSTRLDSTHSTCRAHAFWLCRASRTAQLDSLDTTSSTGSIRRTRLARLSRHVELDCLDWLDTSSSTGATCNLVMITVIHLLFNKLFTD